MSDIRVGNKTISVGLFMQHYQNRKLCRKLFGITRQEYTNILTELVSRSQVVPVPPATSTASAPVPPVQASAPAPQWNPYDPHFSGVHQPHSALPSPPPHHSLPSLPLDGSTILYPKGNDPNELLLNRRFFGADPGAQAQQAFSRAPTAPLPSAVAATGAGVGADAGIIPSADMAAKLLERRFDTHQRKLPDICLERQGIASRRGWGTGP